MKRKTWEYTLKEWDIDPEYFTLHSVKKPKIFNKEQYTIQNVIVSVKNEFLDTSVKNNELCELIITNYDSKMITNDDNLNIKTYEKVRVYPKSKYCKEFELFYGTSNIFNMQVIVLCFSKVRFNIIYSLWEASLIYNLDYTIYQEISEILYHRKLLIQNNLFVDNREIKTNLIDNDNYLIYILT